MYGLTLPSQPVLTRVRTGYWLALKKIFGFVVDYGPMCGIFTTVQGQFTLAMEGDAMVAQDRMFGAWSDVAPRVRAYARRILGSSRSRLTVPADETEARRLMRQTHAESSLSSTDREDMVLEAVQEAWLAWRADSRQSVPALAKSAIAAVRRQRRRPYVLVEGLAEIAVSESDDRPDRIDLSLLTDDQRALAEWLMLGDSSTTIAAAWGCTDRDVRRMYPALRRAIRYQLGWLAGGLEPVAAQ